MVAAHKALLRSCRWCSRTHSKKQHLAHGIGSYLRTHPGLEFFRRMPSAQDVYDWLIKEEVKNRLKAIVQEQKTGVVELTGKTKVVAGEVVGRFAGRFSDIFPELAHLTQGPAAIVRSIQSKRKTALQKQIKGSIADFIEDEQGEEIKGWMAAHPREAVESFISAAHVAANVPDFQKWLGVS